MSSGIAGRRLVRRLVRRSLGEGGSFSEGGNLLICLSLALVIATVGVYLPVRHYGFVDMDDDVFVTENPHIRGGLTWQSVRWAFTAGLTHNDPNTDYWRPLSLLSHAVDIELFGLRPAGHHLMNVGIHAAAAVALFLVLQSMTGLRRTEASPPGAGEASATQAAAPWRCALAAALFALHPLRVESVAWVTERKDVLSGLFFMLTLGAYTRYVRHPFSMPRYLAVFFLFALALMSKSMVVTLPFVLLLLDYWPLGRTRWAEPAAVGRGVPPRRASLAELFREKLPLFALAVASSVVTFLGQPVGGGMNLAGVPLGIRTANALLSYAAYIGKMFWPTGLAVWYPLHPGLSAAAVTAAAIGLVGVTTAVIRGARRRPWLVTGWLWYLGMLVPVIGVFQGSGEAMADRFMYLPSIGLTMMLCWSVPSRAMERRIVKVITCVAAGAVLAVCAALSRVQIEYWKDSETLFRHALDVTRDNWHAHDNLALALKKAGRMQEAVDHYEDALRIRPDEPGAHNGLGNALLQVGKNQEAIGHYEQALRLRPDYAEAHGNLGLALMQAGRIPEAIEHLERAVRLKPNVAEAHYNLGLALRLAGKIREANGHFEQAVQLKPEYAEAHNSLGLALMQAGRIPEAIEHLQQAVRLKPGFVEGQCNLGIALCRAGKVRDAIGHFEQALQLRPDSPEVHGDLGIALELAGRTNEAIGHYEQALRLRPDYPQAQKGLARLRATP